MRLLALLKKKDKSFFITRVIDLLKNGISKEKICDDFLELSQEVWGNICEGKYVWQRDMILSHFDMCADCIYCAYQDGKLVASLHYIKVDESEVENKKTWTERTNNGYLTTHEINGTIAFGVDLSTSKSAPKRAGDKTLTAAVLNGLFGEGLKLAFLGARIPDYHRHKNIPVEEYIHKKNDNGKRMLDSQLNFYVKNGFVIVKAVPEYMEDPESLNYGVIIKWDNPFYKISKIFPPLKSFFKMIGRIMYLR